MKRKTNFKVTAIALALLCLILFTTCRSWLFLSQPPQLYVSLRTEDAQTQHVRAAKGSHDWDYIGGSFSATGSHPLDFFVFDEFNMTDDLIFHLNNANGEIRLQFTDNLSPYAVYVRRWPAEFAAPVNDGGSDMDLWFQYESVEINNNIIHISNDGKDYIYEVEARWAQGWSFYTFRVDSAG